VETTHLVTPSIRRGQVKCTDELIKETQETIGAPSSTFKLTKQPQRYMRYMALMIELIDSEPSCYKEATT